MEGDMKAAERIYYKSVIVVGVVYPQLEEWTGHVIKMHEERMLLK